MSTSAPPIQLAPQIIQRVVLSPHRLHNLACTTEVVPHRLQENRRLGHTLANIQQLQNSSTTGAHAFIWICSRYLPDGECVSVIRGTLSSTVEAPIILRVDPPHHFHRSTSEPWASRLLDRRLEPRMASARRHQPRMANRILPDWSCHRHDHMDFREPTLGHLSVRAGRLRPSGSRLLDRVSLSCLCSSDYVAD